MAAFINTTSDALEVVCHDCNWSGGSYSDLIQAVEVQDSHNTEH